MENELKTLYITNRASWRTWLEENHSSKKDVWLLYYKRHTCKPRIPYDEAVEEAICFGWIDSIIKRIDENTYCQRFTPRREKSKWSELNIERAKRLIAEGRMTDHGLKHYNKTLSNPKLIISSNTGMKSHLLPDELLESLKGERDAYKNFMSFSPSYRSLCISWILSAKKYETRQKRISEVTIKSSKKEKIGMK